MKKFCLLLLLIPLLTFAQESGKIQICRASKIIEIYDKYSVEVSPRIKMRSPRSEYIGEASQTIQIDGVTKFGKKPWCTTTTTAVVISNPSSSAPPKKGSKWQGEAYALNGQWYGPKPKELPNGVIEQSPLSGRIESITVEGIALEDFK